MTELIKVKNASYILYEELLLKKENLKKEGHQYYIQYLQVFGSLMTESFRLRIECIRKKKMITFCRKCLNHGMAINSAEMDRYIAAEMSSYEDQLKQIISDTKAASEARMLSNENIRKIKEIYYRLARRIHPDMRPEFADDRRLTDYWNRIVIAYQNNMLSELQDLEVLVNSCLNETDGSDELYIEDIDDKIEKLEKETEQIISSKPYTYKFLLEDENQTEQKRKDMQKEIDEYEQYSQDLDDVLNAFPIKEMFA